MNSSQNLLVCSPLRYLPHGQIGVLAASDGDPGRGPGVPGKLGTIKRSGGTAQATYDGNPLYTYIGDNAHGNDINLNGGLWHEMTTASG